MGGAATYRLFVCRGAKGADLEQGGVGWLFQVTQVESKHFHVVVYDLKVMLGVGGGQLRVDYLWIFSKYCGQA